MRAACLLLAMALQCGCSKEPDFSERYDAASEKIGATASEIDAELEEQARAADQALPSTAPSSGSSQGSGTLPDDGP